MKNLILSVLSWLLHHANQNGKDEHFYKIKNMILARYGKHICYEVQFIEGKKCLSCKGTGLYQKYSYERSFYKETCWGCYGTGWYKKPCWNILALVSFGKYEFHQPFMRVYRNPYPTPNLNIKTFTGYVERHPTRLTGFAVTVLFLIYEKGYLKRWYKSAGIGWRLHWWKPSNWIHNFFHIIRFGFAIPFRQFKNWIKREFMGHWWIPGTILKSKENDYKQFDDGDLPF